MAHNHPKANQFHWYCVNTAEGSVADAFRKFDESILDPLALKEDNERRYKDFCVQAKTNMGWRMRIFANSGTSRYRKSSAR
jgi:hypothetical protein